MKRISIILAAVAAIVAVILAAWMKPHDAISISKARHEVENDKNIVRFLVENKTSLPKKVTVEITVYSEKPNGISANAVVAGTRTLEFKLNPSETKTITEEMMIVKQPLVLVQSHSVDVRLVKSEVVVVPEMKHD